MRLWHYSLIRFLPREQLLGQHRECCALRGNGWGRRHSTVDYVFSYSPILLFIYHTMIMSEMMLRGYKVDSRWKSWNYRGNSCKPYPENIPFSILGFEREPSPFQWGDESEQFIREYVFY